MESMNDLQNGLDEQKPSLFELLSEQQLSSLVPPSLRYLLALATHRHPRYLLRILNSFDELYALLSLLVERHYLRTYGGSFTENFYGLKRERVLRVKGGEVPRAALGAPNEVRKTLRLRNRDIWRNLAILIILPYFKRKLDEAYDIHAASATVLGPAFRDRVVPADATLRQRILGAYKWFLRKVYPSINAAYFFSLLVFNIAYLFDGSKYHSPFLWLVGTRMRRLNSADHRAIALATQPLLSASSRSGTRPGQTTSIFSPRVFAQTIYPRMLSSLRILLPTSIFALKFLEWWHASDFARQLSRKAAEGLELPPPIIAGLNKSSSTLKKKSDASLSGQMKGEKSESDFSLIIATANPPISASTHLPILTVPSNTSDPESSSLCPICKSPIQTPTATPSGFVYCYACIFRWVDGTHPRQEAFMEGSGEEEAAKGWAEEGGGNREGRWESGLGRCAITGRKILGGTGGLRRVMV
ncbi:ubiquitin-protein ligase peroxin 12 [Elasticomyces elasticus]|nr:ubiquitin-protein ligase peroxin 12 [Elasticomyces elasticus]